MERIKNMMGGAPQTSNNSSPMGSSPIGDDKLRAMLGQTPQQPIQQQTQTKKQKKGKKQAQQQVQQVSQETPEEKIKRMLG